MSESNGGRPAGRSHFGLRVAVIVLAGLAAMVAMFLVPRFGQDPAYHKFADTRVVFGIPYFGDVVTNVAFLIPALPGLWWLARRVRAGRGLIAFVEAWAYIAFFAGVALTCFGSTWYHLDPTNDSMVWDRLPITLGFMGLFSTVISERLSLRLGTRSLGVLLLAGITTVLYWHWTEQSGAGDLRPYSLVQIWPLTTIPLLLILFPARYTHSGYVWVGLCLYGAAKLVESLDHQIYRLTGEVASGHNLKHILAAAGAGCILLMLTQRRPSAARRPATL